MYLAGSIGVAVEELWQMAVVMASLKYIAGLVRQEVETANTSTDCEQTSKAVNNEIPDRKTMLTNKQITNYEEETTTISSMSSHVLDCIATPIEPGEAQFSISMIAHCQPYIEDDEEHKDETDTNLMISMVAHCLPRSETRLKCVAPNILGLTIINDTKTHETETLFTSFLTHQLPRIDNLLELSDSVTMASHTVIGNTDNKDENKYLTDSGMTGSMLPHQIYNEDTFMRQEIQTLQTQGKVLNDDSDIEIEYKQEVLKSGMDYPTYIKNILNEHVVCDEKLTSYNQNDSGKNMNEDDIVYIHSLPTVSTEEVEVEIFDNKTFSKEQLLKTKFGSYLKFLNAARIIRHNTMKTAYQLRISRVQGIQEKVEDEIEKYKRKKDTLTKSKDGKVTEYALISNVKGVEFQILLLIHQLNKDKEEIVEEYSTDAENFYAINLSNCQYENKKPSGNKLNETKEHITQECSTVNKYSHAAKTDYKESRKPDNQDLGNQKEVSSQNAYGNEIARQLLHDLNVSEERLEDYKEHILKVKTSALVLGENIGPAIEELLQLARTMEMTLKYIAGMISQDLKPVNSSKYSESEETHGNSFNLFSDQHENDHIEHEIHRNNHIEQEDKLITMDDYGGQKDVALDPHIPHLHHCAPETNYDYNSDPDQDYMLVTITGHVDQLMVLDPYLPLLTPCKDNKDNIKHEEHGRYNLNEQEDKLITMENKAEQKDVKIALDPYSLLLSPCTPETNNDYDKNPDKFFITSLVGHQVPEVDLADEFVHMPVSMAAHMIVNINDEDGEKENDPNLMMSMVSHCLPSVETKSEPVIANLFGLQIINDTQENSRKSLLETDSNFLSTLHGPGQFFIISLVGHQVPAVDLPEEFVHMPLSMAAHMVATINDEDDEKETDPNSILSMVAHCLPEKQNLKLQSAREGQSEYNSHIASHQVSVNLEELEYPNCIPSMTAHQDENQEIHFENTQCVVSMLTHAESNNNINRHENTEQNMSEAEEYCQEADKYNKSNIVGCKARKAREETSQEQVGEEPEQNETSEIHVMNNVKGIEFESFIVLHKDSTNDGDAYVDNDTQDKKLLEKVSIKSVDTDKTTQLNKTMEYSNKNKCDKQVSSETSENENVDENVPKNQSMETINSEGKGRKRLKIQARGIIETKASKIGEGKEQTYKIRFRVKLTGHGGSSSKSSILQYLLGCLTGESVFQPKH